MRIRNGLVFNAEHQLEAKELCFENGVITENSLAGEYDAAGGYVLPGFIDTHLHGANGVMFYATGRDAPLKEALDDLSWQGVTSILPAFVSETEEEYRVDCQRVLEAADDRILGIHCEGPFMNPLRKGGMHPDKLQLPQVELIRKIQDWSGGMLKILSMAPELENAGEVIEACLQMGIKVSMAHSDATFEQTLAAVTRGASRVTHLYNAMRPFNHRDPGIIGCALTDDRVECELICDLHHVSAPAVRMAVQAKGIDRITMISDCDFYCGLPEGIYPMGDRMVTVEDGFAKLSNGTICGSACSLAIGAKNMFDLGFAPEEIAVMAAVNPARAAGSKDRGELLPGYRADVIVLDRTFRVQAVFVKGQKIR